MAKRCSKRRGARMHRRTRRGGENLWHSTIRAGDPALNVRLGEVTNTLCEGELVAALHAHAPQAVSYTHLRAHET
ncbi:hypothetical protein EBR66_08465, partial [bacterium]|nr:hypothetical protein [bacterium]